MTTRRHTLALAATLLAQPQRDVEVRARKPAGHGKH